MNRYYQSDRTKWVGRSSIGPASTEADRDRKRIAPFAYDGPAGSPVARLRAAYEEGLGIVDSLHRKRDEVIATRRYTPLGVSESLGEHALTESLPQLRRARASVDRIKAEIAERSATLTLAKPTDEQRKEQEEIRAAMRAMTPQQRDAFLKENRSVPAVAAAVAGAIPALSGVSVIVHQHITQEQLRRQHGETISELEDLADVLRTADTAVEKAREELRDTIGCDRSVFEQIAKVAEANNGELPFRVETEIGADQKPVEVAKVYDFNARRWRNATAEEIRGAA